MGNPQHGQPRGIATTGVCGIVGNKCMEYFLMKKLLITLSVVLLPLFPLVVTSVYAGAFFAPDYAAQWVSQSQAGTIDEFYHVAAGKSVNFTATFKNIGKKEWKNSGDEQITFAIYKDPKVTSAPLFTGFDYNKDPKNFGKSFFRNPATWVSDYRIASILEDSVPVGGTGTIDMSFVVPENAPMGCYREDISMAAGPLWISNPVNGDPLNVAHIWVGFCVDKNSITTTSLTSFLATAQEKTNSNVTVSGIQGNLSLKVLDGSLSLQDLMNSGVESQVLSENDIIPIANNPLSSPLFKLPAGSVSTSSTTIPPISLSSMGMDFSGHIDLTHSKVDLAYSMNLDAAYNAQATTNTIAAAVLSTNLEKNMYVQVQSASLPLLSLLPASTLGGVNGTTVKSSLETMIGTWYNYPTSYSLSTLTVLPTNTTTTMVVISSSEQDLDGIPCIVYYATPSIEDTGFKFGYAQIWVGKSDKLVHKEIRKAILVFPTNPEKTVELTMDYTLFDIHKTFTVVEPVDAVQL